jgi:hypothetical protein
MFWTRWLNLVLIWNSWIEFTYMNKFIFIVIFRWRKQTWEPYRPLNIWTKAGRGRSLSWAGKTLTRGRRWNLFHLIIILIFLFAWWHFVSHTVSISISTLVPRLCMFQHNFTTYFPVIFLRHSLVSGIYVAVDNKTWLVLWLKLVLSNATIRVSVSLPSPQDGDRFN